MPLLPRIIEQLTDQTSNVLNINDESFTAEQATEFSEKLAAILRAKDCPFTSIDISINQLGDAAIITILNALADNSSVTKFNALQNNITDQSAAAIVQLLTKNKQLRKLNLGGNAITDAGAHIIAQVLPNTALAVFDLVGNAIKQPGYDALIAASAELPGGDVCLTDKNKDKTALSTYITARDQLVSGSTVLPSVCLNIVKGYLKLKNQQQQIPNTSPVAVTATITSLSTRPAH
jgi:Ran GTPase-activating protein (RanGAP) involved in mRNA processing and transport